MSRITLDNYEAFLLDFSEGKLSGEELHELDRFFALHPELDQRADLGVLPQLALSDESFSQKEDLLKAGVYLEDERLLNYVEGLYSPEEGILFEKELQENEGLRQKLELYKSTRLQAEPVQFERSGLYKREEDLLLKDPAINYIEGSLSGSELKTFETQLASSASLRQDVLLLSKTKLVPDVFIVFEDKQSLKKEAKVIVLFSWKSVARVAALLVLVFSILLPFYLKDRGVADQNIAVITPIPEKNTQPATAKENTSALENKDQKLTHPAKEINKEKPSNKEIPNVPVGTKTSPEVLVAVNTENPEERKKDSVDSSVVKPGVVDPELLASSDVRTSENLRDTAQALELFASVDELKFSEEIEDMESGKAENGFWKKAVGFAKQANRLGVKSIEGEENTTVKYRLSFNSFSVEKR